MKVFFVFVGFAFKTNVPVGRVPIPELNHPASKLERVPQKEKHDQKLGLLPDVDAFVVKCHRIMSVSLFA